jgi:hypothetical protein
LIPVAVIAWWGYFWVTPILNPDALNAGLLAAGVTMWQNLNAAYVVPVALLLLGWFFLETRHVTPLVGIGAGYLGIGLLIGFAGPVLALSSFVMVATVAVASWLRKQTAVTKRGTVWLVAEVGIVLGALASHFSPGSQVRKPLLANPEINPEFALQLAVIGIPGGFRDWWSAITSPGAATVVVVFVGLSLLMVFQGWKPRIGYLLRVGLGLLGFSLIIALVNRSSEFFAYASYHHLVTQQTVSWVALVILAMSLGAWVAQLGRYTIAVPVTVLSTTAGIVLIGVSTVGMVDNIKDRYLQWEIGPAPITRAFTDIEDPDGWQRAAWMALRTLRDVPNRGLAP